MTEESVREKSLYRSDRERIRASLMTSPIDSRKAFEYFGLAIGTLPPFALALKLAVEVLRNGIPVFMLFMTAAAVMTGVAGYLFARFVPPAISKLDRFRQPNRIVLISLIGAAWGAASGAVGGIFLLLIGSVFAAIAGGFVGAATVPLFAALHNALRVGDLVEMKHFLPISLGISLTICALILGL